MSLLSLLLYFVIYLLASTLLSLTSSPSKRFLSCILGSNNDNFGSFRVTGLLVVLLTLFPFCNQPNSFNLLSPAFSCDGLKFLTVVRRILFTNNIIVLLHLLLLLQLEYFSTYFFPNQSI